MDPHQILSKAFENAFINDTIAKVITYDYKKNNNSSKIGKIWFVVSQNWGLIKKIRKIRKFEDSTQILVREFSNICLLIFSALTIQHRKYVIFNINHNLKNIEHQFPLTLYLLAKLGFRFLMLDGFHLKQYIPKSLQRQMLFQLFPCDDAHRPYNPKPSEESELTVGIVGDFRNEKSPMATVIDVTNRLQQIGNVKIKIGARSPTPVEEIFSKSKIKVVCTAEKFRYYEFLKNTDIILIFAKRESYFSRHSGTIMDSVSHGVVVVAPSFPVFESQLNNPITIGITYNSIAEIDDAIQKAASKLSTLRANMPSYRKARETPLKISTYHD